MVSSSSSSSFRRTKPSMSIITNSISKKPRRGSVLISPLRSSSVVNGASSSFASKALSSKSSSGANHRRSSTSNSYRVPPNTPSTSASKSNHAGPAALEYGYRSLEFTGSGHCTGDSSGIQRCPAILGSDVILPEAVASQQPDTKAGPSMAHSRRATFPVREPYILGAVDVLGDMGMFANTLIPQGGVIVIERPALIVPADVKLECLVSDLDGFEPREQPYDALFSRVDDQVKQGVFALKDCLATGDASTPAGIFHTNALDIELETASQVGNTEQKYRALFIKTSRCNHSCGPNSIRSFDRLTYTLTLSAARTIYPGEEITISYVNPFLPRHLRRAHLHSIWNFTCHCPYCDIPWTFPGALAQSDKARQELGVFFERLPDWEEWCIDESKTRTKRGLIEVHLRAMQMREREGLEGFIGGGICKDAPAYMKHIDALVMCYGALADVQGFRLWVGKARDVKVAEGSLESAAHVKVLDMWLREPRKFYVWGWKEKLDRA